MKFLIQKINGQIRHDFSFTLIETIRFKNWLNRNDKKDKTIVKYISTPEILEPSDIYPQTPFKPLHKNYTPVGSVEFVTEFLQHFHGLTPEPINVPECLFEPRYSQRPIFNGTEADVVKLHGKWFVKSNDGIKKFAEILMCDKNHVWGLPKGDYQFSEFINIDSEWRTFVYDGKIVGLKHYSGEFIKFPNVQAISAMVTAFENSGEAPIAYTLDVGVNDYHTFVIEVHDFFSCGLYGFNDAKYPTMLHRWFEEYLFINF